MSLKKEKELSRHFLKCLSKIKGWRYHEKIETDKKLQCEMTIRAGAIVYDLNGIANPIYPPKKVAQSEEDAQKGKTH